MGRLSGPAKPIFGIKNEIPLHTKHTPGYTKMSEYIPVYTIVYTGISQDAHHMLVRILV
jgi:hypothetical protein